MTAPPRRPSPTPGERPRPRPHANRSTRRRAEREALDRRRGERLRGALVVGGIAVVMIVAIVLVVAFGFRTGPATRAADAGPAANDTVAVLSDQGVADGFVAGATADIAAVTSYDYRSLDDALSNGLSVTTGQYHFAYEQALTGTLAASARKNHTVQDFQLSQAGIGTIAAGGRSAQVLMFGTQTTTRTVTVGGRAVQDVQTNPVTLTATMVRDGEQYLISALVSGANAGLPPGTAGLAQAAEAGREEVVSLLTYRRDRFDADLRRTLAGAVDPLRSRVQANAPDTEAALVRGRYDEAGAVTAVAVEHASGDTLVLLMAASGTRSGADTTVTDSRYEVTVVRVGDSWRTSDVSPVL